MKYELSVLTRADSRRIAWETDHPQTAHKWFRFVVKHGRTIDTGATVSLVALARDGVGIKSAAIEATEAMADAAREQAVSANEELFLLFRRSVTGPATNKAFKRWVKENWELMDHLLSIHAAKVP